jgi:hypothetical protein
VSAHAIIAPSSLARIVQCPRSVALCLPYMNDPPTPESLEGTAAHWVAMMYAHGAELPVGIPTPVEGAPPIDQDMIDGAELWRDIVGLFGTAETLVKIPRIHATHCWGTPDNWRADQIEQVLRIFDYKYGHRYVEVFENWQLLAYAVGVLDELGVDLNHWWVEFVLVQPRQYGPEGQVRRWKCRASDLTTLANIAHAAAGAAIDESGNPRPDAPAATGEECRDCPARHECTLFQRQAAALVDMVGRAERFNLPPAQLGAELTVLDEALQRLEARREGLAIQAQTLMQQGAFVPGYEMRAKETREQWLDNVNHEERVQFGLAFGVDFSKPAETITPAQARAALKRKKIDPAVLDSYASRPRGEMKLAKSDITRARKVFGANKHGT